MSGGVLNLYSEHRRAGSPACITTQATAKHLPPQTPRTPPQTPSTPPTSPPPPPKTPIYFIQIQIKKLIN